MVRVARMPMMTMATRSSAMVKAGENTLTLRSLWRSRVKPCFLNFVIIRLIYHLGDGKRKHLRY